MKNFLSILCIVGLLSSCSSAKKGSSSSITAHPVRQSNHEPRFLENIVIKRPGAENAAVDKNTVMHKPSTDVPGTSFSTDIETCRELQFKYAILMEEPVESITDSRLIFFLEDWYGVPYKYGGETKKGIDCSAFSSLLLDDVYRIDIPRTSRDQYQAGTRINKSQLSQGDLVFFNTSGGISHVGVFLANNKFVHAATSGGVMISDLEDAYFKRRYVGSAKFK